MDLRLLPLSVGLLAAVILAAGCSKRKPAAGTDTATNAAQAEASAVAPAAPPTRGPGPMAPPARPAVIANTGDMNATLNQLSLELRRYVIRTRSVPKNFEDFVAKSQVQVPAAPAGQKYAIQDQAVVLVKR
jgi:hypothetical protein